MPHANAETLQRIDQAMLQGDFATFFTFYTDDIKVHVRGNHRFAGDYEGKDQFESLFSKFMEATGNYSFENHAYLADDEHGVVLQTSRSERDGQTLTMQEVFVAHFRDGKVAEMWYIPVDGPAFDAWIGR